MQCVLMDNSSDMQLAWLFLYHRYIFFAVKPCELCYKACVMQALFISLLLLKCRATALDSAVI